LVARLLRTACVARASCRSGSRGDVEDHPEPETFEEAGTSMKYILDTNVVSSLMKGEPNVIERLKRVARADVFMPQPVVAEIAYGIQRLARSKRKEALASRFELLKAEIRCAVWSDDVSDAFGVVKAALERKGERIEDFDAAVAAHAVAEGGVLVTANLKHMMRVPGLEIEDWSQEIEKR